MIVLKDKTGRHTKVFGANAVKEAQELVDSGDWLVDTDKYNDLTKAKKKKTTKKKA